MMARRVGYLIIAATVAIFVLLLVAERAGR